MKIYKYGILNLTKIFFSTYVCFNCLNSNKPIYWNIQIFRCFHISQLYYLVFKNHNFSKSFEITVKCKTWKIIRRTTESFMYKLESVLLLMFTVMSCYHKLILRLVSVHPPHPPAVYVVTALFVKHCELTERKIKSVIQLYTEVC